MLTGICPYNRKCGFLADAEFNCPPFVVVAKRGCSHRGSDHAFFLHRCCGEVNKFPFLQRLQIESPSTCASSEEDCLPIVRWSAQTILQGQVCLSVGEVHPWHVPLRRLAVCRFGKRQKSTACIASSYAGMIKNGW